MAAAAVPYSSTLTVCHPIPTPNGPSVSTARRAQHIPNCSSSQAGSAVPGKTLGTPWWANRDGPPEEKGSYAYQQDFVNYHLGVFATKP